MTYPPRFWCKPFFRTAIKCDVCHNNLYETFNSTLVQTRQKPIINMLEDIRVAMMTGITQKMKFVRRWVGNHDPLVIEKLNKNMAEAINWQVVFNGGDRYKVKCGRKQFKVNIVRRICAWKS